MGLRNVMIAIVNNVNNNSIIVMLMDLRIPIQAFVTTVIHSLHAELNPIVAHKYVEMPLKSGSYLANLSLICLCLFPTKTVNLSQEP